MQDDRLQGGYENVPTRDVHYNQIGYERQFYHLLQEYVRPIQEKVYTGYFHNVCCKSFVSPLLLSQPIL